MKVSNTMPALRAYQGSAVQQEALVARTTHDKTEQVRIAENSKERLVLLNLALNENINEEAVEKLFDRDLDYVDRRLESLGYEKPQSWLKKVFG